MINFINIIIVYQNQQKNTGKDLFKGLKVIEATKTSAEVIKLETPKYGITAVEYINGLYEYYGDSYNLKIDNTKDKIVTETIDVLESFSINISNAIENVDSKINTESKERQYQIERLNNLTEYDKIVLRNLESRISILEEESQDYRRATN